MPISTTITDQFVRSAERAAATVLRLPATSKALGSALRELLPADDEVLFSPPQLLPPELYRPLLKQFRFVTQPDADQLEHIGVGLTEAFAGVARTGSVCVAVDSSLAGTVSLFTREHIAILDSRWIVARPRDVFTATHLLDQPVLENVTFITGPSATADMGPLVRGVHGPGKLVILLLEH